MLRHFQANGKVIPPVHFKGFAQVSACEAFRWYQELGTVNVLTVDSSKLVYAQFLESPQPSSSPAANIDYAGGSEEGLEEPKHDPRRLQGAFLM